ncbi:MAG: hypothetical protein ACYTEG_02500, partial [Planctomycetota bacterium]
GAGGAYRGPSGGVPPGLRAPGDPQPPAPDPSQTYQRGLPNDAPFSGPSTNSAIGIGGGDSTATFVAEADEDVELEVVDLDDVTSGLDDSALYEPSADTGLSIKFLRRAAGRVSLRIDLPREGHVFHFATSGSKVDLQVEADEEGGSVGKGLLALVLLGAAVVVMRFGR